MNLQETDTKNCKFLFDHLPKPDLVLFVQTDFDIMLKRIRERGNLTLIEKKYTSGADFDILISNYMKYIDTNKTIIDNNKSIDYAKEQINRILK